MKCAICGREFGNGMNCQNCGADKVTGLGNYSGYSPTYRAPSEISSQPSPNQSNLKSANLHVCYACGEVIPADSKFCPYCSRELYVTCPKCGKKYSSQYPACNECGTNYAAFYEMQRKQKEEADSSLLKIKNYQKSLESTPEGRAELEREKRIMDEYRKKWKGVKL